MELVIILLVIAAIGFALYNQFNKGTTVQQEVAKVEEVAKEVVAEVKTEVVAEVAKVKAVAKKVVAKKAPAKTVAKKAPAKTAKPKAAKK
jgi:DNA-binding protein HU-beta